MRNKLWRVISAMVILTTWCLTSCGVRPQAGGGEGNPSEGVITISGAWALYPMVIRWEEEYRKAHPGVEFDISVGGAGKGMADVLAGAVDIGMVSRDIYPEEAERGAFWVAVTRDAVFLTVNENNPVWEDLHRQGVSQETLVDIYITGRITSWGQVVGRPEVSEPIHLYTRSDACGAAATWAEYLGKSQEDLLGIGVYGDPGVLNAVVQDPLGMGYNNLNFAYDADTGLPAAGVGIAPLDVNANGNVDAGELTDTQGQAVEAVASGEYPSPPARDLNLVTKGQPSGLVKDFIAWVLTGGQEYVSQTGYIPLPKTRLEGELSKLEVTARPTQPER